MSRKKNHVLLLILLVLFGSTTACLKSPLTENSSLTVLGTLETTENEVVKARIVLNRGKHTIEAEVPVHLNEFQGTIQVPVGQWELTVLLLDTEGIVRFQSEVQDIQISFNEPSFVELVLHPAASTVKVEILLDDYILQHETLRARIHFDDIIYETTREDSTELLEKTIEVLPGSYEFKIELYTESFRVGDRLGPGVWQIINIGENEEIVITWSPDTESLQIAGRVETILPAPENLRLAAEDGAVVLTWNAVNHRELAGYFLLAQTSLLERFELLNSVPIEDCNFRHILDLDPLPAEINYVVAAVSKSGLVGYYSEPQVWKP